LVSNSHFYTISEQERNKMIENCSRGWVNEGIAFYVYASEFIPVQNPVISDLMVKDKGENFIEWQWNNPANFNGNIIKINGVKVANLSNSENTYRASNLEEGEYYTIDVYTITVDGIVNSVAVSNTARTDEEVIDNSKKRTVVREIRDETPVIFTSINSEDSSVELNQVSSSNTKEKSNNFFDNLSWIHYILAVLIVLSLIVIGLIIKYI